MGNGNKEKNIMSKHILNSPQRKAYETGLASINNKNT